MRRQTPERRTLRAYLAALRRRSGIKWTLLSLVLLSAVVVANGSWVGLAVTLAVAVPTGLGLGYRNFLRTGEV